MQRMPNDARRRVHAPTADRLHRADDLSDGHAAVHVVSALLLTVESSSSIRPVIGRRPTTCTVCRGTIRTDDRDAADNDDTDDTDDTDTDTVIDSGDIDTGNRRRVDEPPSALPALTTVPAPDATASPAASLSCGLPTRLHPDEAVG